AAFRRSAPEQDLVPRRGAGCGRVEAEDAPARVRERLRELEGDEAPVDELLRRDDSLAEHRAILVRHAEEDRVAIRPGVGADADVDAEHAVRAAADLLLDLRTR